MVSIISSNVQAPPVQNTDAALPKSTAASSTQFGTVTPQPASQGTTTSAQPELEAKLADTLKNTGFKAEVDTSNPDQVVVRIVDGSTGDLVVQIPSVSALVIAEALRKGTLDLGQSESGALFDEAA